MHSEEKEVPTARRTKFVNVVALTFSFVFFFFCDLAPIRTSYRKRVLFKENSTSNVSCSVLQNRDDIEYHIVGFSHNSRTRSIELDMAKAYVFVSLTQIASSHSEHLSNGSSSNQAQLLLRLRTDMLTLKS